MAPHIPSSYEVFRAVLDNLPAVDAPLLRKCRVVNKDIKNIADDVYSQNDLLYDSFDENNVFSAYRFMVVAKGVYDSQGSEALYEKLKNQSVPAVLGGIADKDFRAFHFLEYTEDVHDGFCYHHIRLEQWLDPCDITSLRLQPTSSGITPLMMSCTKFLRSSSLGRFVSHVYQYHIVLGSTETRLFRESVVRCLTVSPSSYRSCLVGWWFYYYLYEDGMLDCLRDDGPAISAFLPIFISQIQDESYWTCGFMSDFKDFIQNRAYPKEGLASFLRCYGKDMASAVKPSCSRVLRYIWEDFYFPAFDNKADALISFLGDYIEFDVWTIYCNAFESYIDGTADAIRVSEFTKNIR